MGAIQMMGSNGGLQWDGSLRNGKQCGRDNTTGSYIQRDKYSEEDKTRWGLMGCNGRYLEE